MNASSVKKMWWCFVKALSLVKLLFSVLYWTCAIAKDFCPHYSSKNASMQNAHKMVRGLFAVKKKQAFFSTHGEEIVTYPYTDTVEFPTHYPESSLVFSLFYNRYPAHW